MVFVELFIVNIRIFLRPFIMITPVAVTIALCGD
jgi:hypothetical protein